MNQQAVANTSLNFLNCAGRSPAERQHNTRRNLEMRIAAASGADDYNSAPSSTCTPRFTYRSPPTTAQSTCLLASFLKHETTSHNARQQHEDFATSRASKPALHLARTTSHSALSKAPHREASSTPLQPHRHIAHIKAQDHPTRWPQ